MRSQHQPHIEDAQPRDARQRDERSADVPPPAPAPRPSRRWIPIVALVLVPVLLAAAAVLTYLAGGLNDDGRFRAEPSACAALAPSLHRLGVTYTMRQNESNNCDLLLSQEHPDHIPFPEITVAYYVATPRRQSAPDAASQLLRQYGADLRPLADVGDEAYIRNRDVFLRVSNLLVAILVFPVPPSTEDQVRAFAADLADRLAR